MDVMTSVELGLLMMAAIIPSVIAAVVAVLNMMKIAAIKEMVNGQRSDMLSEIAALKEEIFRLKLEIQERSEVLHKLLKEKT